MGAAQKIWILEQYKNPLRLIKEDNNKEQVNWVFEGPCADFNEENDNGRMYDKDDYLSHFSYLQPQIDDNALAGELDHAEDYNPKMKDLSHVVRKLWYNEELNQVWIRIELFEEGDGKKAIEYARKGMPLYISSRASGYIDDDGNVTLDTIYTFDIVYRPGFKVAELKRKTGGDTSEGKVVQLFESSKKYSGKKSSIMLLEWKEPAEDNKINNKKETFSKMEQDKKDNNKPATIGDLNKIYETINGQIQLLKKAMNINDDGLNLKPGLQFVGESKKNQEANQLNKKILEGLGFATKEAMDVLSKKINVILEWSEMVRKAINEQDTTNKRHHRHINMITNSVNQINESGSVPANLGEAIAKLKKDTAVLKKYADINTNFVNKMADKQDLIYEHANLTTKFVNEMNDNATKNADSLSKIESNISTIQEHANVSSELVNNINEKVKNMSKKIYEEANQEQIDKALTSFDGKYDFVDNAVILLDPTISNEVSSALTTAGIKNTKESDTKLILEELDEKTGEVKVEPATVTDDQKITSVLDNFAGKAALVGGDIIFTDQTAIDEVAAALSSAGISTTKEDNKLIVSGAEKKTVEESKKTAKGKFDINKINNKVESKIALAKKKTANKVIDSTTEKYPFVSVLENNEIVNFSKLNDVKKKTISDKVYESGAEDRGSVLNVIRSVNADQGVIRLLSNMPNKVKPVWNKLDQTKRNQIISLYNIKTLNSDMEVKAFWESLNIGGQSVQRMDENLSVDDMMIDIDTQNSDSLGYADDDIKASLNI